MWDPDLGRRLVLEKMWDLDLGRVFVLEQMWNPDLGMRLVLEKRWDPDLGMGSCWKKYGILIWVGGSARVGKNEGPGSG